MNQKKFLEISSAKSLALLIVATIVVLYITRGLGLASGILMIFLGLSALIKIKVEGTELKEKKSEIKKGIYFSVAGIFFGLIIKKIIGFDFLNFNFIEFDFTVEMILLLLLVLVLKEVYSQKKDKWINAFVLMGTFLVCSGSLVVFTEVLSQINLI